MQKISSNTQQSKTKCHETPHMTHSHMRIELKSHPTDHQKQSRKGPNNLLKIFNGHFSIRRAGAGLLAPLGARLDTLFFQTPKRFCIKTETIQQKTALQYPPYLQIPHPAGVTPNDRGRALQPTAGNLFLSVVDNQTTHRATRMRVARLL